MRTRNTKRLFSFVLAIILSFSFMSSLVPARATYSFTLASGMKSSMDDSEEWVSDGLIDYNSSDLEIGYEKPTSDDKKQQIIAVRFADLKIPQGATVTSAYIQFTADIVKDAGTSSKSTNPFDIKIYAEDTANSAAIENVQYNISSRTLTATSVSWPLTDDASLWTTMSECGTYQQTSDISSLVQYIVDKSGWASGNAMCFQLKGTGNRTAATSEDADDLSTGPVLHVTFDYDGTLDQAAPSGLTGVAPTSELNNDGQITGTSAAMAYRPVSGSEWTACTGTSITGLASGAYEVRYAEKTGYNASAATTVTVPAYVGYSVKDLTLQLRADETQMNFCWYSDSTTTAGCVQIAAKSAMTGTAFPESSSTSYNAAVASASSSYNSNEVTVTGLTASTEYVYRVGDGTYFSTVHNFKTQNSESYSALLVGDPQIGCSNTATDTAAWQTTLTTALATFPNTSFILSAGDQVETSTSESQYDGFFAPAELLSVPLVPTIGNHDNGALYAYHYNSPEESAFYGTTSAGGDYYFTYGNTLYMVLNSNNQSATSHDVFIGETITAAGSGIKWKVVMLHHSIYSSA
ncbi:MAG: hypothetical protein EOM54_12955, partial [Clostridia bacterium]|nr:hypothetical protein [Clostridia bacterium]